jgi:hypothetical protein
VPGGRKLIERHIGQEQFNHTAIVLDFARQKRRRGDTTVALPVVEYMFAIPDLIVNHGLTNKAFVELERRRNKQVK